MGDGTPVGSVAPSKLMVVEDSAVQLGIMCNMLAEQGYDVRPFRDGHEALAAAADDPPDLCLFDVNMPGLTGYELCRLIKEKPGLESIPVIFISAKYETKDKIEAFAAGGVDYMTKPYQIEEVRARVETHLDVFRMRRQLEEHNRRLEEKVEDRTRELAAAKDRLAMLDQAKSDFLRLISHELRTPLNGVLGVAGVILKTCADQPSVERLERAFREAQHNLLSLVDDALLLTQISVVDLGLADQTVDLGGLVREAVDIVGSLSKGKTGGFVVQTRDGLEAHGDRPLLVRALCAVLETAVLLSQRDEQMQCSTSRAAAAVTVVIETCGHRIPDDALQHLFDPFAVPGAVAPGGDLGLRLVVAKEILALFDAKVEAQNLEPAGVRFEITFPGRP